MRRMIALLLMVLAVALLVTAASAEIYVFDDIYGRMEVPDSYIVLMPSNLKNYETWLEARGISLEDASNDFEMRGVLLQAWSQQGDTRFELRIRTDEATQMIYDVNEQSTEVRAKYRTSHYPGNEYVGYEFSSSEWKNTADNGRFLILKYTRRDGGEILYRGFMRRTIRNGYEIDFDMQVYGRNATSKDNVELNKIWDTFKFVEVKELPALAAAKINISEAPPEETKEQSFSITGTASEGVKLTAVTMGLSYADPIVSEVIVGKNGKFSLPIKLPKEGVFLITLTGEYKDEEVVELAYPVTYERTMLAVNFIEKPASVITYDDVKITGTSEPGASIQVFVDGKQELVKKVTTAGKFAVEVEIKEEGEHEISLVFSKKGLADKRFSFAVQRKWTDTDMMNYLKKQAVSPSYAQLVNGMQKYEGRVVTYRAYITDVAQSGDEYIVTLALNRKDKKYSNFILVTTDSEPNFAVGSKVQMFGTCEGMSLSTGTVEEGTQEKSYPCFALLLFATLE